MIIKCRPVSPNDIASDFDHACPQHDSKDQAAKKDDDIKWWCTFWKGTHIKQGAKKNREKSCFQHLNFPAVAVPILSGMYERHIKYPEYGENNCICISGKHYQRQQEANPRGC